MEPWSKDLAGRLDEHELDSAALAGNPLGDPARRPLWVYEPPGAEGAMLPAIYLIQGFTGQVDMWRNRSAFRPSVIELIDVVRALRDTYGGSYNAFLEDFRARTAFTKASDPVLINTYAMAACYSAGELPFDTATGQLKPDVWGRWLARDPVRMVDTHADAL